MRSSRAAIVISALWLSGCGPDTDAEMWDCQLSVQKGNAGKDAAAAAERSRDIEACMDGRGFRLEAGNPACLNGSTNPACYGRK